MPLALRSVQVSVKCGDEELPMYNVEEQSDSVISACIASVEGQRFTVSVHNGRSDYGVSCRLYMDNQMTDGMYVRRGRTWDSLGAHTSPSTVLPYHFKRLEVFDPDSVPDSADLASSISPGLIEAKCVRVTTDPTAPKTPAHYDWCIPGGEPISERSKKAGWHCVGVDSQSPIQVPETKHFVQRARVDAGTEPYITFRIFYKPEELLRAQKIIPLEGCNSAASETQAIEEEGLQHQRSSRQLTASGSKRKRSPSEPRSLVKAETQEEEDEEMRQQRIQELLVRCQHLLVSDETR
ncbi:hypothetical protein BC834DRAFT_892625 [Gloeopeniophorella convolvens]|nr:hypothetical protein BC834DRAFT_892625 [Gloeopeniophorella convolvens]